MISSQRWMRPWHLCERAATGNTIESTRRMEVHMEILVNGEPKSVGKEQFSITDVLKLCNVEMPDIWLPFKSTEHLLSDRISPQLS